MPDDKIAVFIDSENINSNDYTYISKELTIAGTIIVYNVYGDWNDENSYKWIDISKKYGINKIQVDKIAGKESVDHKICVDMMEYLHTNRHIDIFYLITSDSDFRHVIHKIREYNKKVHCIGNSTITSCLVPVCNKYTRISVLKMKEEFSNITSPIQLSKTPAMKKRKKITMISDPNTYSISRYSIIINNIIKPRMRYHLSFISDELLKNYPDFDYKIYGTNTFSKFILKYYKNLEIFSINNTNMVRLKN
jgi:uncharacterized protein (TIGR00288 family)